jgi:AraC-like DNA-binding protein
MERARSADAFVRAPVGRWILASPTTLVFAASPELVGCFAWGRPAREDIEGMLAMFLALRSATVARSFDVVLDGSGIEGVDPAALACLLGWLTSHRAELVDRIRVQYGVIHDGMIGVLLAGILPVLGETHAFRVVRDPGEAFRALSTDGDAIFRELEALVTHARSTVPELRALRELLRSSASGSRGATIERAATTLGVSVRSLQRGLAESGTTFRDEVRDARFEEVQALLVGSDDKVATIARRAGISENALTQLVREKSGVTPAELRKRHR